MRIFGIGTDIVRVERMAAGIDRFGERFARKLLCAEELGEYAANAHPAQFLAKRFAAKEAAVKALGTGFRQGITLAQIRISHDPLGRPLLTWQGEARAYIDARNITQSHLSISDEKDLAVAFVTLCCEH